MNTKDKLKFINGYLCAYLKVENSYSHVYFVNFVVPIIRTLIINNEDNALDSKYKSSN